MGIVETNYKKALEEFGAAHKAAELENAKQQKFEQQKEKNRQLALKRGKIAVQKLKEDTKMKSSKPVINVKEKKVVTVSKMVESSPESSSSDSSTTTTSTSTSSSSSSDSSVILVEDKKKATVKNKNTSKGVTSPKKISSSKPKSPLRKKYDPQCFASANNSTTTDISLTDSPLSDPPPFITKVSDLLGRKPIKPALRSSPHIAKTYRLDKSPVAIRTTTKKTPQKQQINTVSSRLSRVIKTPSKTSGKSPMKVLPTRQHFVPEFVKNKPSSTITRNNSSMIQTTPNRTSRVQFYDHANRFSKQYNGNIDLEEEIENIIPPNAWQEAKRKISLDEVNAYQLLNMK